MSWQGALCVTPENPLFSKEEIPLDYNFHEHHISFPFVIKDADFEVCNVNGIAYTFHEGSMHTIDLESGAYKQKQCILNSFPDNQTFYRFASLSNCIYSFGGDRKQSVLFCYDTITDTFSEVPVEEGSLIPMERAGHGIIIRKPTSDNPSIVVWSGFDHENDTFLNDMYEYHFSTKQWQCVITSDDSTYAARTTFGYTYDESEDAIYMLGGFPNSFDLSRFSFISSKWTVLENQCFEDLDPKSCYGVGRIGHNLLLVHSDTNASIYNTATRQHVMQLTFNYTREDDYISKYVKFKGEYGGSGAMVMFVKHCSAMKYCVFKMDIEFAQVWKERRKTMLNLAIQTRTFCNVTLYFA